MRAIKARVSGKSAAREGAQRVRGERYQAIRQEGIPPRTASKNDCGRIDRATRRMAEIAHHLGSTTRTDRRRQTRPAGTMAALTVINGVYAEKADRRANREANKTRAVEAKRNLRGNGVDGPTETASDAMQRHAGQGGRDERGADRRPDPTKRNPIAEAMMATVGASKVLRSNASASDLANNARAPSASPRTYIVRPSRYSRSSI